MPNTTPDIRETKKVTWVGLVVNLAMAAVKFAAGIFGGSQAVVADAVHSLSDMSTDVAVLLGVRYWSRPADEEHPFGHRRIETLVTLFIGLVLIGVAVGIGYRAIATIRRPDLVAPRWFAILGSLVSIIIKEGLYNWTVAVGTRVKSPALIANAWHHRSDALSSIPPLLAVSLAVLFPHWAFVDHVGAIVVSLFILKVSWDIAYPSLSELMDQGASKKEVENIEALAKGVAGVKSVHAVRTRMAGGGFYVDLHIQVDGSISVTEGHELSGIVKSKLLNEGPNVVDVLIHVEPE